MDEADRRAVDKLARLLASQEQRIARAERGLRAVQLSRSSIEDASLDVHDDTGTLRQRVGLQHDGTVTTTDHNGPPPPAPTAPSLITLPGGLRVSWDGGFVDAATPADFARIEVHVALTGGFTPSDDTRQATIETPRGAAANFAVDDTATRYVLLVAVNTSGADSPPSGQRSIDPLPAGEGIRSYYGMDAPADPDTGDLWVDSGTGILHRWDGVQWIEIRDEGINQAITDAAQAQQDAADAIAQANTATDIANSKITTYYQATAPVGAAVGDLWIDTGDDTLHRWDGAVWVAVRDDGITQALADAQNAQTTADGKIVSYFQATAPVGAAVGDLWFDTGDGNQQHWWDGGSWSDVPMGSGAIADAAVDAAKLADESVTTGKLSPDSVDSDSIRGGSVTGDKLNLGDTGGVNIVPDPSFESGATNGDPENQGTWEVTTTRAHTGAHSVVTTFTSTQNETHWYWLLKGSPVTGSSYALRFYTVAWLDGGGYVAGRGYAEMGVRFFDSTGTAIGDDIKFQVDAGAGAHSDSFRRGLGRVQIPYAATLVSAYLEMSATVDDPNFPYRVYFDDISMANADTTIIFDTLGEHIISANNLSSGTTVAALDVGTPQGGRLAFDYNEIRTFNPDGTIGALYINGTSGAPPSNASVKFCGVGRVIYGIDFGFTAGTTNNNGDVEVPHSLGVTPTSVQVTVDSGTTWINPHPITSTFDASHFWVRFANSTGTPVASGVAAHFYWLAFA
ncbi:MAG: hypothetical protein ACRDO8_06045 [Nocardioidaceae bacterium]